MEGILSLGEDILMVSLSLHSSILYQGSSSIFGPFHFDLPSEAREVAVRILCWQYSLKVEPWALV